MSGVRRRDLEFLLYNVFGVEALAQTNAFAGQTREFYDAILDTALRVAADTFAPCAAELDANEPHWVDGQVIVPESLKKAVQSFVDAGFVAAPFPEADGGLGLPYSVFQAFMAVFSAANISAVAYPLLTIAAANLLNAYGSKSQKKMFFEPMIEGRYFGTMCLSETQAGSSLSDIQTVATPRADGNYDVVGNKMWISGGEHELSENIIHLVLARIAGSPAGIKGISLFIVPRFRVSEDGSRGEFNDVNLAGLNHKMGYRGTVNTVLNFGENQGCIGYLVGEPNQGLKYMFHMMNEARIGVGLGANMLGYAGYRFALQYAKERPQGRPVSEKNPQSSQIPIIAHVDVRRMLLAQKAYVEGGLGLSFYCARLVDEISAGVDVEENRLLLDLLTPLAKAWPSEYALEANSLAIQVLGGYGYTRDYPVERYYRDNRLNPIHEGTNGIQALDLLGRKVTAQGGRAVMILSQKILADVEAARELEPEFATLVESALHRLVAVTQVLTGRAMEGDVDGFLANATEYLHMAGHVVVAWLWLKQCVVANRMLQVSPDDEFCHGKVQACAFFMRRELPKIETWAKILESFEGSASGMREQWF